MSNFQLQNWFQLPSFFIKKGVNIYSFFNETQTSDSLLKTEIVSELNLKKTNKNTALSI